MADSTGPIIAVGAITLANRSLLNRQPIDWRVPIATGIAAGFFALLEKGFHDGAVAFAWLSLVTVLFVRLDPKVPAPTESLVKWMKG